MNDKILLLPFLTFWSILYTITLLIDDNYYEQINKINTFLIKENDNNQDSFYHKKIKYLKNTINLNLLVRYEAEYDINKHCQITVLNSNIMDDIIYNIENNNDIYFTKLR